MINSHDLNSHRMTHVHGLILLLALQILFLHSVIILGHVICPHDNSSELLAPPKNAHDEIDNRFFSDQTSAHIPEMRHHLTGNRHGWLSVWNPHCELGRPTFQHIGLSRIYFINYGLSLITHDPFRVMTLLTALTVCLLGVFAYMFFLELGLLPTACLAGATGLSMTPVTAYWLNHPMFISTLSWTLCLLWLTARFVRTGGLAAALGISFATYCMLLSAYPQSVVVQGYLIAGFALVRTLRHQSSAGRKAVVLSALIAAAVFGSLCALPLLADLFVNASRSARAGIDPDFFFVLLPNLETTADFFFWLYMKIDGFLLGNPIRPEYEFLYDSSSLTPLFAHLSVISLLYARRQSTWGWYLFIAACFVFGTIPEAYLFAIKYLGLRFSRIGLSGEAVTAFFILSAYSADYILRNRECKPVLASIVTLSIFATTVVTMWIQPGNLHIGYTITGALVTLLTLLFIFFRNGLVLISAILVTVLAYGQTLVLSRPIDHIRTDSPLVSKIREHTSDGSRFAKVGPVNGIIPPNQEALLDLKSIHTYNSLSSRKYQNLCSKISDRGPQIRGRVFREITGLQKLSDSLFSLMNVGLILTRKSLPPGQYTKVDEHAGIRFYKPATPRIEHALITDYSKIGPESVVVNNKLFREKHQSVRTVENYDDFSRFRFEPSSRERLLFISREYHPAWRSVQTGSGQPLKTVEVNDFFLGVLISPQADDLAVEFLPYSRWMWVPMVLFAVLGLLASARVAIKPLFPFRRQHRPDLDDIP